MRKYIYERDDWPNMICDERVLRDVIAKLLRAQGKLFGKLDILGFDVQNELLLSAVSDEVVTSSEIEGELLNRSSVRSSVAKRLGLETAGIADSSNDRYTESVVEMALDATQNSNAPVTDDRLFGWHAALFPTGRSGMRHITVGAYRIDDISIVSGAIGKEKVHYTAPMPGRVPHEMKLFLDWLETEQDMNPYVKAGVAHLWFEAIHPFDDGNGRIGRAIADLLLARADNMRERYYSLSAQLLKERRAYYTQLELATSYSGDIEQWASWFLGCLVRAVEASEEKLETAKRKAAVFERLRNVAMNERQVSMMSRLLDGFLGKLTTAKWAKLCKCSHDTALRDIEVLIAKGVLLRSPEGGRSTSYILSIF